MNFPSRTTENCGDVNFPSRTTESCGDVNFPSRTTESSADMNFPSRTTESCGDMNTEKNKLKKLIYGRHGRVRFLKRKIRTFAACNPVRMNSRVLPLDDHVGSRERNIANCEHRHEKTEKPQITSRKLK